jgi:hypothetical protein
MSVTRRIWDSSSPGQGPHSAQRVKLERVTKARGALGAY